MVEQDNILPNLREEFLHNLNHALKTDFPDSNLQNLSSEVGFRWFIKNKMMSPLQLYYDGDINSAFGEMTKVISNCDTNGMVDKLQMEFTPEDELYESAVNAFLADQPVVSKHIGNKQVNYISISSLSKFFTQESCRVRNQANLRELVRTLMQESELTGILPGPQISEEYDKSEDFIDINMLRPVIKLAQEQKLLNSEYLVAMAFENRIQSAFRAINNGSGITWKEKSLGEVATSIEFRLADLSVEKTIEGDELLNDKYKDRGNKFRVLRNFLINTHSKLNRFQFGILKDTAYITRLGYFRDPSERSAGVFISLQDDASQRLALSRDIFFYCKHFKTKTRYFVEIITGEDQKSTKLQCGLDEDLFECISQINQLINITARSFGVKTVHHNLSHSQPA